MRDSFEKWAFDIQKIRNFARSCNGDYANALVQSLWTAWETAWELSADAYDENRSLPDPDPP
jgi:hypothetical protein